MRTLLVVVVTFAFVLLARLAQAQQPTPANPVQAAAQACNGACGSVLRACLPSPDGKARPEVCDTGLIACTLECGSCVVAFSACMTRAQNADPAAATCQTELTACRQRSEAASQDRARPMITFGGGDGRTIEAAVIIKGVRNTREGIQAEDIWILKNHADWRKGGQAVLNRPGGKVYDRIEYQTPVGQTAVYFEISDFFGKM